MPADFCCAPHGAECCICVGRAGKAEEALAAFEASQECDPLEEQTFVLIADAKFRLRRFDDVVAYTSAMPLLQTRHPELLMLQATSLLALGLLPQARAAVSKGNTLCPDHPQMLALAGNIAGMAGDTAAAERYLRRALALTPEQYDALVGLAGVLAARGETAPARQLLDRAIAVASDRLDAPLLLAGLAFQDNDKNALEHWTREGLKAAPAHPGLLFFLGWLAAEADKLDVAEAVFSAAILINPRHQASQFALARLLLKRQDQARAIIHLRNTVQIDATTAQGKAATEMLRQVIPA